MKFTIKDNNSAVGIIELFKVIKNLNNYCTLCCKKDELWIQAMDGSHVCLFDLKIKKDWFDDYEANEEIISFNSNIIVKILNLYSQDALLNFETSKNEEFLNINLCYQDNNEKSFVIPLIDLETDMLTPQEMESSIEFEMNTKQFDKYISEMLLFGESVEIKCIDDNLYLKCNGDEGKYTAKIPHDNLENFEVVEDCNMKISASIKYFSYISKIHGIFKTLQFKLDENAPICIQINNNEYLSMLYFIAPKTEDDNNNENDVYDDEDELEDLENEIV